jgi:SAM-dependent methyltransferase
MSVCILCGDHAATPLFRSSDRLYRTTTREFDVVRCGNCGLLRLDPLPEPAELRLYYPENYWFAPDRTAAGRLEEAYRRLVLRDHVRFVAQAMGRPGLRGPLLDVGCGGGLFLGMMRERGFRVLGLDFSPAAAAIAWKRQQVPAVCAALEAAPFPDGSIGGLTMFHVLEHLADPRAYLKRARQLLSPDGRLVVQVPNAACWQFRLLGRAWTGVDVPRHLVNFRSRDLEALLESSGFAVQRRKYFSLRDNPAGLATSLAPSLDPMARRIRRLPESSAGRLGRDFAYLALVAAAVPFSMLEAACGAGSTVMLEARPR